MSLEWVGPRHGEVGEVESEWWVKIVGVALKYQSQTVETEPANRTEEQEAHLWYLSQSPLIEHYWKESSGKRSLKYGLHAVLARQTSHASNRLRQRGLKK